MSSIDCSCVQDQPDAECQCWDQDLVAWMGNLPECVRNRPIIELAIPGTHDSFTYTINAKSRMSPDAEPFMLKYKNLKPLRAFMARWSKTQAADVVGQLYSGIRFFDLRTSTSSDGAFYFVHGLYGAPVKEVFMGMTEFLDNHSGEVIILDCQHFYKFEMKDHEAFKSLLRTHFGSKIYPLGSSADLPRLTLSSCYEKGKQVIVIYRKEINRDIDFLPSSAWPTPWPNASTVFKLMEKLKEGLKKRDPDLGYVTQFLLTPDAKAIIRHACCGNSYKYSAKPLYKKQINWIKSLRPGKGGLNVIIADFINFKDSLFPKAVIRTNYKLVQWTDIVASVRILKPIIIYVEPMTEAEVSEMLEAQRRVLQKGERKKRKCCKFCYVKVPPRDEFGETTLSHDDESLMEECCCVNCLKPKAKYKKRRHKRVVELKQGDDEVLSVPVRLCNDDECNPANAMHMVCSCSSDMCTFRQETMEIHPDTGADVNDLNGI